MGTCIPIVLGKSVISGTQKRPIAGCTGTSCGGSDGPREEEVGTTPGVCSFRRDTRCLEAMWEVRTGTEMQPSH